MGAQNELLKAGGSVLALAGLIGKLNSKFSDEGTKKAKKGYEKAVNTKKENKELTKKNIEEVATKKPPQHFAEFAHNEETTQQANTPTEKKIVEAKSQIQEVITADNAKTKIPVDEDVRGLIEVKQKNLRRAAAASKARTAYIESKTYEEDFPIRDYMPDVSDEELKKAGLTKTELNNLGSILAGNGTEADVQNWFEKHGAEEIQANELIHFGNLRVQEEAANAIKTHIIDKNKYDVKAQEEYELSKAGEETYEVWQEETKNNNRNFDGIVF